MLSAKSIKILSSPESSVEYNQSSPFPFLVIDDFFREDIAKAVSKEFPDYSNSSLDNYSNAIEEKKLVNHWNKFGSSTYKAFSYLCSDAFVSLLSGIAVDSSGLKADIGLHGGGLHMHGPGGKLNVHMDYSIHPKLKLQRKLNLLIYLTPEWNADWGGSLGLYGNENENAPGKLFQDITPIFNRAVLFDVTKNSWHGLPSPIQCPEGITRNSLAVYYLQEPDGSANPSRVKARFAPTPWQANDTKVLELIEKRSGIESSRSVYENQ